MPTPDTTTRQPARSSVPSRVWRTAFMAHHSPYAVAADGSPEPPRAGDIPLTLDDSEKITSMSAWVVPTSSAVR